MVAEAALHIMPVIAIANGGVQRRQFVDLRNHAVGDRDDEPKPCGVRFRVDRIVEVAGVLAVDRNERQFAEILPRSALLRIDLRAERLCFAQRAR